MTNHQANHQRPQHHEDYKVQKLVDRIEAKLALQAKAKREANKEGAIPRRRNLRVIEWVGTIPATAVCTFCDRLFLVPLVSLKRVADAQWSLSLQFDEHKCKGKLN
jgi:hypothetical protein